MQRQLIYLSAGLMVALMIGLVLAVSSSESSGSSGMFSEKYIVKLQVRVHRGGLTAWETKIESIHYELTQSHIAFNMEQLGIWTGDYKVCAVAYRDNFELDRVCRTVKLSPGDTKDVFLSLNIGEKPTAQVRITIYDEGGEIKDEKVIDL